MLRIRKDACVYIVIPARAVTGGPEALHQLSDAIIRSGGRARVIYISPDLEIVSCGKPVKYLKYRTRNGRCVVDDPKNVIVVPERCIDLLGRYTRIQKCIWWLSINYRGSEPRWDCEGMVHLYQSHYVLEYLRKKGARSVYPLFDYISINRPKRASRHDWIAYNPEKGIETTEKIRNRLKDRAFIALENMSVRDLSKTLSASKVYIDFGNHPGKDRIPREAALSGCVVITGRVGSAAFYDDIPIEDYYKVEDGDVSAICDRLADCIENYESHVPEFDYYRKDILLQKVEFHTQVRKLFTPLIGGGKLGAGHYYLRDVVANQLCTVLLEHVKYVIKALLPERIADLLRGMRRSAAG